MNAEQKASRVKLLVLDVDGVLTDGSITISSRGEEMISFNVKDGLGVKLMMDRGIEVIIISGRSSAAVAARSKEIGVKELYQGVADKQALLTELIATKGLESRQVCAMGDDLPELGLFRKAGVRITPPNASKELKALSDYETDSLAGSGAVREACEWILKCQGKWSAAVAAFS